MNPNDVLSWATNRAWSRAGAVAAVMSAGMPRRVLVLSTRVLLLVAGSFAIAVAVAAMLWNSFGPGPLDVFIAGLHDLTGVPLTFAYWGAFGLMLAVAVGLGRRPGIGTVVTPLILGPAVQVLLGAFGAVDRPSSVVVQVVVHLAAIAVIGLGAGALIVSGLGAGTGELLAGAASDRTGHAEHHVRIGIEMSWLAVGALIGGPVGPGTVLVAVLIGPAVATGHRVVNGFVGTHRHRLAGPVERRVPAPV